METRLIEKIYDLKSALNNSKENIELKEAENKMEESEEVMALSYRYSVAQTEYNDVLKIYKEDSDEAKKALKKLYESKKVLEEHPLVRDYLSKYSIVRQIYDEIDNVLYKDFRGENICNGSCHDKEGDK